MIPLRLDDVVAATRGDRRGQDVPVQDVTTDSRSVPDRSLFVALRGDTHDGHDHIADAVSGGAVAYVAERPADVDTPAVIVDDTWQALRDIAGTVRDRVDPTVVAITGSVGKTTTKDLIAAACGAGRRTVAAPGSFNNEVGVPLTCLLCEDDTEVLVIEVGSRGVGHIADLMPLVRPDITVVTAVSGAHLEMFGDLDTVTRAKGELVEATASGGAAVLNVDDERVATMVERTGEDVLWFGRSSQADVTAEDVELDRLARPSFRARTPWGDSDVRLPLAGEHQVGNALAALAVAGRLGIDVTEAAGALADAQVSAWRGEISDADGVTVLNDAYNANPASMRAALRALTAIQRPDAGRTWAVLGVMAELGPTADEAHHGIGGVVAELDIDRLIVVGDDAAAIADGARAAGMPADHVRRVADADAAAEVVVPDLEPGDVVLVKASRVGGLEAVADRITQERAP